MNQIEFFYPPPITAHEAAAIIGRLGGKARAEQMREPIRSVTRDMRAELGLPPHPALDC